jgi:cytochrome d ubiquinol oxidase subunit II
METLQTIWFLLVGVLFAGYAVLDGFDFGVGVLHLFTREDRERRLFLNAIGPVWDGNEVWLLTGGGALFAAFPVVYAAVFSGFYMALVLLLAALIARAVSMEFRGKVDAPAWRRVWDRAFGIGSLLGAVLLGVAFGNILRGIPINDQAEFTGTFLGLLNPYALLIGVLSLALFVMHGALYMGMKTEGALRDRMGRTASRVWIAVVALYAAATAATTLVSPFLFTGILKNPLFWILFLALLGAVIAIPLAVKSGRFGRGFLASSVLIACMIGLSAASLFPRLVPSSTGLIYSLTVYNASSTEPTLSAMLWITLLGMPLVVLYTIMIHRVFRGHVVIGEESY